MAKKLTDIQGIGDNYAQKLQEAGITSAEGLLEKGATPKGRKEVAGSAGLSSKLILRWVNHADLFRVKGIGGEYAELLEASGVDTVPALARRNAGNLHQKMMEINGEKNLVRKVAAESQIGNWIEQAKELSRVVKY